MRTESNTVSRTELKQGEIWKWKIESKPSLVEREVWPTPSRSENEN